jgi:hypothetical protein
VPFPPSLCPFSAGLPTSPVCGSPTSGASPVPCSLQSFLGWASRCWPDVP